MAFRWRADDGPSLNAGSVASQFFRGSGPELLRNPIFVIFQGGGGVRTPGPPSGSAHGDPVVVCSLVVVAPFVCVCFVLGSCFFL